MVTRSWKVELWFDAHGTPYVCVTVDGLELLPAFAVRSPVEVLEYIDEALVDFRRGDKVTLIARRPPALMSTWTTRVRALALHWCADVLQFECSHQVDLHCATGRRTPVSKMRAPAGRGGQPS